MLLKRLLQIIPVISFAAAMVLSSRAAAYELLSRTDIPSLTQAAKITGNADYYQRLVHFDLSNALEIVPESLGLRAPANKSTHFATNWDSRSWTELGLAAEQAGDLRKADAAFASAERIDRQYLPAWTRANFSFRHNHVLQFWQSAKHAALMAYDDQRPLLNLADRLAPDPLTAVRQLGNTPALERAYLDLLIEQNRFTDAYTIAEELAASLTTTELPSQPARFWSATWRQETSSPTMSDVQENARRIGGFLDRLIERGYTADAVPLWTKLQRFAGIQGHCDDALDASIFNAAFIHAPTGRGFDWTVHDVPGVHFRWQPGQLRFEFSGSQPEEFVLIEHALTLPRTQYKLHADYRLANSTATGFHWVIRSAENINRIQISDSEFWESPELSLHSALAPSKFLFDAFHYRPSSTLSPLAASTRIQVTTTAKLQLIYRRDPATALFAGDLELQKVQLIPIKREGA